MTQAVYTCKNVAWKSFGKQLSFPSGLQLQLCTWVVRRIESLDIWAML